MDRMPPCEFRGAPDEVWLLQHVWRRARLAALARAGFECERCARQDAEVELHVHHDVEVDPPGDYTDGCVHHAENLHVLCVDCHALEHANRRAKPGAQLRLVA